MPLAARLAVVFGAVCALPGGALRTAVEHLTRRSSQDLKRYSFHDFAAQFNRAYEEGTEQWNARRDLFEKRRKEVMEFNALPNRSWTMGVSPFMDYTAEERRRLLGYRSRSSHGAPDAPAEAALLGGGVHLPSEFSVDIRWGSLMGLLRDQGDCGSCWANAAASTLEGQMAANKTLMAKLTALSTKNGSGVPAMPTLSSQMVVSCTPNQRHCGGTGGCGGATVEQAYTMVMARGGLPFAIEWPYESGEHGATPKCKSDLFQRAQVSITGYTRLPMNRASPLKQALVQSGGPVAISVDASHWFDYDAGIFSDRDFGKGDFNVDHSVTLMAYKDPGPLSLGYWYIKNSWGFYWGEEGYIRLEMKKNEETHCGWDLKTHDGVACDGDPNKAWVCGTCGLLYDSVFPTGVHMKDVTAVGPA